MDTPNLWRPIFREFYLSMRICPLTVSQSAANRRVMNSTKPPLIVRLFVATLVTVAIIGLSALAIHAPAQTQSPVTLKSIQTDRAATLYTDHRPTCAWFVEAVYAAHRPTCAWFVEAVLPTSDRDVMTEHLQSVAATL
jgi:Mn2+/Fe2+ NRAMP family transporter